MRSEIRRRDRVDDPTTVPATLLGKKDSKFFRQSISLIVSMMACKDRNQDCWEEFDISKIFRSKGASTNNVQLHHIECIEDLDVDNFVSEVLEGIDEESAKQKVNVFGDRLHFECHCDSLSRCPSVTRMAQCLDIWTSSQSDCSVQLSRNTLFAEDYHHLVDVHIDSRNEFEKLHRHFVDCIGSTRTKAIKLPDRSQEHTFYVNAMWILHCYFFGDLV